MEICVSKLYGPPKKRSILTIRKFPRGCGMKATETIIEKAIEVNQLAPSSETTCSEKKEGCTEDMVLPEDKVPNGSNVAEKFLTETCQLAPSSETACSEKKEGHDGDVTLLVEKVPNHTNVDTEKSFVENDAIAKIKEKKDGCTEGAALQEDKIANGVNVYAEKSLVDNDAFRETKALQEGKVSNGTNVAEKSLFDASQLASSSETACLEKKEEHDGDVTLQKEKVPNGINVDTEKTIVDDETIAEIKEKKEGYTEGAELQEDEVANGVNMCAKKSLVDNNTFRETKDTEVKGCTSKLYGPAKRRRLSAVRRFPPDCGPLAAVREICYISPEANTLIEGKEPTVHKIPFVEDSSPAKDHQKATRGLNSRINANQDVATIGVSTTCITEGNTSGDDTKKVMSNDSTAVFETEKKKSWTRDTSLSKPNGYKKSSNKRKLSPGEAELTNKVLMEDSDNFMKKTKREKAIEKSTGKASSELVDEKSQLRISHGKELSKVDSKNGNKANTVEKDPRSPVGKSIPVKQGKGKIQKRKYTEELEEERRELTPVCKNENDNSDSDRDRVILLALMASPNCPWRQGKGSARAVQQSSSPSVKTKRKIKSSSKKLESHILSDSRDICISEAQIEDLPLNNVPQDEEFSDEETERGLLTYESPKELCVMETPLKPLNWNQTGIHEEVGMRNKVRRALRLFQVICRRLLQEEESKSRGKGKGNRVDLEAANIMKKKDEYVNPGKPIIGLVPGVEIGDEFHYRTELAVIGLHRPFQAGIDKTKVGDIFLATSIVAGCGSDEMESSDILVYSGSGGSSGDGDKPPEDQKLEGGNLALKNSLDAKQPVRVIRSSKDVKVDSRDGKTKTFSTFVYDGLYIIEKYWKERVRQGFLAFKFELRRIPGQPQLPSKEVKKSPKPSVRPGVCIKDISDGKEKMSICVVNTIDNDRPSPFRYIKRIRYPSSFELKAPKGCDCKNGCSDSEKCACAVKNGGEIPYNYSGAIVQAKPLVYECGPMCKCPPTCHNRVSQHGIKIQLEVFKTKSMGWGVRSLSSIASGSFICEYIGELIPDKEAELRTNDEYLFDIGHNYDDHSLWEGLPTLIPELQSCASQEDTDGAGFTIDAAEFANVGRFINHSCSPNLYAQNVLYDHDDKRMPHIMLFAAENIPPLQELTYHYNYMMDQVRDNDGNVKKKDCYCGSDECTGRLY